MNNSPRWDLQSTRQLIGDLYGRDQLQLARQSINSIVDRQNFARMHYREAMGRWDQHLIDIKDCHPIESLLGSGDEVIDSQRELRMSELAAHVHACVHSLHTIPDIMAHGLYYGLRLADTSPLSERAIKAKSVTKILGTVPSLNSLRYLFTSLHCAGDFAYLDALNNHSKHRSLVPTSIWSDQTGAADDPISLRFAGFVYEGDRPSRDIRRVLIDEYERISKSVVECGIELLHVLQQRKAALAT